MSWSRIKGHAARIDAFQGLVRRGRLAHAYLFVGPPGVGKSLFAHELAKAMLCERNAAVENLQACDECTSCILFAAGTHPDFFMVRPPQDKRELPIELMRELCQDFGLKAARGGAKVAIVEDADAMNEEAANCFLKTLEEPPPHSLFILIGGSPDRQLPTILSRSHIVRFPPLPDDVVDQVLAEQGVEASQRPRLVEAADGSAGQALALADEGLWKFRRMMLEGFGRPRIDVVALSRAFVELAEEAGKEAALQRRRAAGAIDLFAKAWTKVLRLRFGDEADAVDSADREALRALARRADAEQILEILERCLAAERQLGLYIQTPLVLEGLVESCARILEENPAGAPVSSSK